MVKSSHEFHGVRARGRYVVPESNTVPHVFPGSDIFRSMPEVFATAFMVGLMEWACMEAMRHHLEPNERTVGTHINVSHVAPTPPGMEVSVAVRCVEVNGRRSRWQITARDEKDLIGEGTHERFVIDNGKFVEKVREKAGLS